MQRSGPSKTSFKHSKKQEPSQVRETRVSEDVETSLEATHDARLKKIFRKIDRRIIPPFWVLYFLCSAIRSNVSLAQTMNSAQHHSLKDVLHLTPKQVSTGLALFYVCYVVFDCPSNLIMSKLSPHVWMSRIVISVGIIGTCMTAMKAAWSLYLLRLLLGIVIAGMWPGMTYYLTLFYPPSQCARRIGHYYTAAQVSAAVVGLVSAGFQKMDGLGGLVGFQWMFLIYGLLAVILGFALLWWLPPRPVIPGSETQKAKPQGWKKLLPRSPPALTGDDALLHYQEMSRVYQRPAWGWKDLGRVLIDWRLWPLTLMYFGVVGVGIGVQSYGTVIIHAINPSLSSINLSLLFAPIWICDLIAILLITPFSDKYHHLRPLFFIFPALIIMAGLLITTYSNSTASWSRYGGLLIVGFGLGPTVPVTMTWTSEIFSTRHGEVGVAAATALVSGLGNLGSILTTYALYTGWPEDANSEEPYRKSNLVAVGIVGLSIVSCALMSVVLRAKGEFGGRRSKVEGSKRSSVSGS
ncbi:hypothetical protein AAFC00_000855 [Neodothiora populina]